MKKQKKKVEIENNNTKVRTPESPNQNIEIQNNEQNSDIKKKKTKNVKEKKEGNDFLGKKVGRKKIETNDDNEIQNENEGHTKFSEDNMMRKIKTNAMEDTFDELNGSLNDKTYQFLKINKKVSAN